jgi:hypothetical protein
VSCVGQASLSNSKKIDIIAVKSYIDIDVKSFVNSISGVLSLFHSVPESKPSY